MSQRAAVCSASPLSPSLCLCYSLLPSKRSSVFLTCAQMGEVLAFPCSVQRMKEFGLEGTSEPTWFQPLLWARPLLQPGLGPPREGAPPAPLHALTSGQSLTGLSGLGEVVPFRVKFPVPFVFLIQFYKFSSTVCNRLCAVPEVRSHPHVEMSLKGRQTWLQAPRSRRGRG